MKRDTVAILARHPLFRKLAQAEKSSLFSRVKEEEVDANTLIFREGTQGDSLYVVVKGNVLLQRDVEGDPSPIMQLAKSESFGEIAALNPGTRLLTAKAVSPGLVARLSSEALTAFGDEHPRAAVAVRGKILDNFLIKVRHLQPLWEQLLTRGIASVEAAGSGL